MKQVTMNEIRQMSIQQIRARNIKIAQIERAIARQRELIDKTNGAFAEIGSCGEDGACLRRL